jgi:hypothetical protein
VTVLEAIVIFLACNVVALLSAAWVVWVVAPFALWFLNLPERWRSKRLHAKWDREQEELHRLRVGSKK